ncbi:uncharacterized protein LOC18433326 isoform X1 [Amborella trichopoda]|uniref:J domain-containing protein n=1 Tax=Amborella trichopoda TaxID=13333 RepID=W1PB61_AMBTC|nr:uncharacterized protein LOC18433326 isoform X1 [Amborella trichopoda]ERN05158.1 hypothetical protein AMTR_s00053p00201040 [Amborella trichopoda]|eukprot:XP_006843483.3 uncharacterized protein LOC18433326 isoform X1 [Amborella trichopoda]
MSAMLNFRVSAKPQMETKASSSHQANPSPFSFPDFRRGTSQNAKNPPSNLPFDSSSLSSSTSSASSSFFESMGFRNGAMDSQSGASRENPDNAFFKNSATSSSFNGKLGQSDLRNDQSGLRWRPRLAKSRRHLISGKGRPPVLGSLSSGSDGKENSGAFNPFKHAESSGSFRGTGPSPCFTMDSDRPGVFSGKFGDNGKSGQLGNADSSDGFRFVGTSNGNVKEFRFGEQAQSVQDRIHGWNPFSSGLTGKSYSKDDLGAKDHGLTINGEKTSTESTENIHERKNFSFGGGSEAKLFSFQGTSTGSFSQNEPSMLPDKLRKLKIETETTNNKGPELSFKVDKSFERNGFTFGTNGGKGLGLTENFNGNSKRSTLQDEMKKMHLGNGKSSENEASFSGRSQRTARAFAGTRRRHVLRSTQNSQVRESANSQSRASNEDTNSTTPTSAAFGGLTEAKVAVPMSFIFQMGESGVKPSTANRSKEDVENGTFVPPIQSSFLSPSSSVGQCAFVPPSLHSSSSSSGASFTSINQERSEGATHFSFSGFLGGVDATIAGSMGAKQGETPLQNDAPKFDDDFPSSSLPPKFEFNANVGTPSKSIRNRKKKENVRHHAPKHLGQTGSRETPGQASLEPEASESYSPMDFSPYRETLSANESSRGSSVASDSSFHLGTADRIPPMRKSDFIDGKVEILSSATRNLYINEGEVQTVSKEGSNHCSESSSSEDDQGFPPKPEDEALRAKLEKVDIKDVTSAAASETDGCLRERVEKTEAKGDKEFSFSLKLEETKKTDFTFVASSPTQTPLSSARHHFRKKHRLKVEPHALNQNPMFHPASPSIQPFPLASSGMQGAGLFEKGDVFLGRSAGVQGVAEESKGNAISSSKQEAQQDFMPRGDRGAGKSMTFAIPTQTVNRPSTAQAAELQELCEKWRLRGNQAYANGDLHKAEDYYSRGANSIPPKEMSTACIRALMLCYSNRAATRMALGRVREALMDCSKAIAMDKNFLKAQIRAANCHLALGEIDDALAWFKKCLQFGNDLGQDNKVLAEASDGLQKAQQVVEYMDRSAELLHTRTSKDAATALAVISNALSLSSYSECLIEMKADALFLMRKYEDVIQFCEQTLDSAERNFPFVSVEGDQKSVDDSASRKSVSVRLWRWHMISKSYFHLGKLEEALDLLQKHQQASSENSRSLESVSALIITIQELLRHKAAGNESFQSGKHAEAVEHYGAALACTVESHPFAAICFCNRAAAHQILGNITDAVADCTLAIALDANYAKAISRRATLHELIRDYGQAINDLKRLISLLEKQEGCGKTGRSSILNDLRQARGRLAVLEEEAKKGLPLDLYLILGVESSSTASEIKKAYRKAALRHHPDKAGQFLARNENGDERLWKEVADEAHKDADRLFKMIGEAYAVLSDPVKRVKYDNNEEMRNLQKKGSSSHSSQASSDPYGYPFERGANRRNWRGSWQSVNQRYTDDAYSTRYN